MVLFATALIFSCRIKYKWILWKFFLRYRFGFNNKRAQINTCLNIILLYVLINQIIKDGMIKLPKPSNPHYYDLQYLVTLMHIAQVLQHFIFQKPNYFIFNAFFPS